MTYFYDGVQVGRITSGVTSSPMYLVLNLGLSSQVSPPVSVPSEMLVDYVRVTRDRVLMASLVAPRRESAALDGRRGLLTAGAQWAGASLSCFPGR